MSSRRTARVAEAIREQVSSSVLFDIKDPRVRNVTVTRVEVTADLKGAKVYVSIMGDEKTEALCLHGLKSARGYLQSKVADRLQTRYTPILHFVVDRGVKRSIEASRLLRSVMDEDRAARDDAVQDDTHASTAEADERAPAGRRDELQNDSG